MIRAALVQKQSSDRVPSERLRGLSEGYHAASEALIIAADLQCDGRIYDALSELVLRWEKVAQARSLDNARREALDHG